MKAVERRISEFESRKASTIIAVYNVLGGDAAVRNSHMVLCDVVVLLFGWL